MKKQISILILFFLLFSVYAQKRTLEVTKPRMHGDDVKIVQTKLVELGFTEIGEIDGYYGPKSEGAVKELKSLIGFPVNGYVNESLYAFLETKNSDLIHEVIKVYNQNKNKGKQISYEDDNSENNDPYAPILSVYKSGTTTTYCYYGEEYDFYSLDAKIFKLNNSVYFLTETESTAYNPNGDGLNPWDENAEYEYKTDTAMYIMIEKDLFQVKEGKLEKSNHENYVELINSCKKNF